MRRTIILAVVFLLVTASGALGQTVAIAGGVGLPLSQPTLTYETRFVPDWNFTAATAGDAGQAFTLTRSRRVALWASLAWFPATHAGMEVRIRSRSAPLDGTSSPYRVSLTYVSRQPPDDVPREFTTEQSYTWPEPEGTLRELSVDVAAVGRFGDVQRLQVRVSGGLALVAASGDLRPVGLTVFRMGGHSVLFPSQHAVDLAFERTWTVGAVGGLEVQRALGSRMALVIAGRLLVPRRVALPAVVTMVDPGAFTVTPVDAQRALNPPPLTIRPWAADLLAGLRLAL